MGWHKGDKVPVIMGKQPEPIKERKREGGVGGEGGRKEGGAREERKNRNCKGYHRLIKDNN